MLDCQATGAVKSYLASASRAAKMEAETSFGRSGGLERRVAALVTGTANERAGGLHERVVGFRGLLIA